LIIAPRCSDAVAHRTSRFRRRVPARLGQVLGEDVPPAASAVRPLDLIFTPSGQVSGLPDRSVLAFDAVPDHDHVLQALTPSISLTASGRSSYSTSADKTRAAGTGGVHLFEEPINRGAGRILLPGPAWKSTGCAARSRLAYELVISSGPLMFRNNARLSSPGRHPLAAAIFLGQRSFAPPWRSGVLPNRKPGPSRRDELAHLLGGRQGSYSLEQLGCAGTASRRRPLNHLDLPAHPADVLVGDIGTLSSTRVLDLRLGHTLGGGCGLGGTSSESPGFSGTTSGVRRSGRRSAGSASQNPTLLVGVSDHDGPGADGGAVTASRGPHALTDLTGALRSLLPRRGERPREPHGPARDPSPSTLTAGDTATRTG